MKKIAVFLPVKRVNGMLQRTKNIVKMLAIGSLECNEQILIVLSIPKGEFNIEADFSDILEYGNIQIRETIWQEMNYNKANTAFNFSGNIVPKYRYSKYMVPNDNINCFFDCDNWLLVSGYMKYPLLPIKDYGLVIFNCAQSHIDTNEDFKDISYIENVRNAKHIFVNIPQVIDNCKFHCGISPSKFHIVDSEIDFESFCTFDVNKIQNKDNLKNFFMWILDETNYKRSYQVLRVLEAYYEEEEGTLPIVTASVNPNKTTFKTKMKRPNLSFMQKENYKYFLECESLIKNSILHNKIKFLKIQNIRLFNKLLYCARFLIYPEVRDNGENDVIKAAYYGTPCLSCDSEQMIFLNECFKLNLGFTRFTKVNESARLLKYYEDNYSTIAGGLPTKSFLENHSLHLLAANYYRKVSNLL